MKKINPKIKIILCAGMGVIILLGVSFLFSDAYTPPYPPDTLKKLEYSGQSVIVINPRLTAAAYSDNGFYAYYNHKCDESCLSIPLREGPADSWGPWNKNTVKLLKTLNYPMIDDSELHIRLLSDPHYLDQYKTVILLHSEYATKELFDSITNHKHVIYLAPNALYAEVTFEPKLVPETTYDAWGNVHVQKIVQPTLTLVRGHNYPEKSINNGFGWEWDNSPEELDLNCTLWKFRDVSNGEQLNCVQEIFSQHNPAILKKMKELIT